MSIAAFTFGSFGDIIALIELTKQIYGTLDETTGASKDYLSLVAVIHEFSQLLENVQNVHKHLCDAPDRPPPSVQEPIYSALTRSKVVLDTICAEMAGYQKYLRTGGSGNRLMDILKKVKWGVFKQKDIKGWRRQLEECRQSITTHLAISHIHSLIRLEVIARENGVQVAQLYRNMERRPASLGLTWERGTDDSSRPIMFYDMLGKSNEIPFQFCITKAAFDGLVKLYFESQVGRSFVDLGDYDLTATDNLNESFLAPIDSNRWKSIVKPGCTVYMNAILRRMLTQSAPQECPSCQNSVESHARTEQNVAVECTHCHTRFTVTESQSEERSSYAPSTLPPSSRIPPIGEDTTKDLYFLRRVRIMASIAENTEKPRGRSSTRRRPEISGDQRFPVITGRKERPGSTDFVPEHGPDRRPSPPHTYMWPDTGAILPPSLVVAEGAEHPQNMGLQGSGEVEVDFSISNFESPLEALARAPRDTPSWWGAPRRVVETSITYAGQ